MERIVVPEVCYADDMVILAKDENTLIKNMEIQKNLEKTGYED